MELGFDGVLLNSAVSNAVNPPQMAAAFKLALQSGRLAYEAGMMPARDFAVASTPYFNRPFNDGIL
jgi:thiazole synthase